MRRRGYLNRRTTLVELSRPWGIILIFLFCRSRNAESFVWNIKKTVNFVFMMCSIVERGKQLTPIATKGRLTASKLHANVNYILISFEQFRVFFLSLTSVLGLRNSIAMLSYLIFMHNSFCIALTPIIIITYLLLLDE